MTEPVNTVAVAEALARFPRERTWLLPALQAVQEIVGHLPDSALAETARHLRVPDSEVYGVATHYPEFRRSPRGTHHVRVCTGVSCSLSGGRELLEAITLRKHVKIGEMGADKALTLEEADCFFECSVAPLLEVDGVFRGRVTPETSSRWPAGMSRRWLLTRCQVRRFRAARCRHVLAQPEWFSKHSCPGPRLAGEVARGCG